MTYYKIIRDGQAVDAGFTFLRWDARHGQLMGCEARVAQYIQSRDGETVYRVGWLNPVDANAPVFETIEARIIDVLEYADLIEQLDDGETVPEPVEPEPEPTPGPEPEPEPEHRMTVQEMREAIAALTSMEAKDNIARGSYFVLHDEIYQATRAIVKGSEIKPGYNCVKKSLNEAIQ